jgi:hypothetical protein
MPSNPFSSREFQKKPKLRDERKEFEPGSDLGEAAMVDVGAMDY